MTAPPIHTTSMVSPLMLRRDLTRQTATDHWKGVHADKVKKLPNIVEYNQRLFSETDHGFWPTAGGIGTIVPDEWHVDGCAEIRFRSQASLLSTGLFAKEVYLDEQNAFARVLGQLTGPGGGRWWTTGFDGTLGQHVAVLLRRRRGARGTAFHRFVRTELAPALVAAGAADLRAYTFLPWTALAHQSPGVAHDNPIQHRYHGMVFFGAADRAEIDSIMNSAPLARVVVEQNQVLTAAHAFALERTVPVIGGPGAGS
ncbi:hypothetical protein ABIA30_003401 [Mycobacterium sp. MAA66]|uniref:EthD domain-containing protein n=1 Tax=Mycobacterium sp. MAA66 TaxID=3156297 RepID=UPI003516FD34